MCLKNHPVGKWEARVVRVPISNFTNGQQHYAVVPGSQTIVNIRGVQKLHLPSDSRWKFLTHQVICHGEIHRNVNNLLQTFISSLNWVQWLSMVVYHKSSQMMQWLRRTLEAQHSVHSVRCSRLLCPYLSTSITFAWECKVISASSQLTRSPGAPHSFPPAVVWPIILSWDNAVLKIWPFRTKFSNYSIDHWLLIFPILSTIWWCIQFLQKRSFVPNFFLNYLSNQVWFGALQFANFADFINKISFFSGSFIDNR